MKYRHTDTPSLLQRDRDEIDAICYRCKKKTAVDFHHILNGSKYMRQRAEEIGAWIWLCPACHRWVHGTGEGAKYQRLLKGLCQSLYEQEHSRREWMAIAHKNYVD